MKNFFIAFLFILISITISSSELSAQNKFLNFSDVHFDPFYDSTLVEKLVDEDFEEWGKVFQSSKIKDLSKYGEDSNYPLFISALKQMKLTSPNPDFIIITGDFMSHNFNENFKKYSKEKDSGDLYSFIEKTIKFTNYMITKSFPRTQIFVTVGNDDAYCGNYMVDPKGEFLEMFYETWEPNINYKIEKKDSYRSLEKFGYGMVNFQKEAKLKMIILNTIYFSQNYKNACGNSSEDPGAEELDWLKGTLQKCKDKNYKVWLCYHIPPGIDIYGTIHGKGTCEQKIFSTWKSNYNDKFLKIIKNYSGIINSTLAGHFHRDDFRVILDNNTPVSYIHLTPSLSPVYGNNPSYEIFEYDKSNLILLDYDAYYLNDISTQSPSWAFEYNFGNTFKQNLITASTLNRLSENIFSDSTDRINYIKYYTADNEKTFSGNYKDWFYNWCGFTNLTSEEYAKCLCDSLKNE